MPTTGLRFPLHPKTKAPTLLTLHLVHDYTSGPPRTNTVRTGVCAGGNTHVAVDKQDQETDGGMGMLAREGGQATRNLRGPPPACSGQA